MVTDSYEVILDNINNLTTNQLKNLQMQIAAQISMSTDPVSSATTAEIVGEINTINTQIANDSNALQTRANSLLNQVNSQMKLIEQNNQDLSSLELRNNLQMAELENKKKLIETRNRMLQVSQEKNVFRKKLINIILALIVGVTVLILVGYMTLGSGSSSM